MPFPESSRELTVLMPCLNEAATLAVCIGKAKASIARLGIDGEVLIADNGSTDGSQAIAAAHGARVIAVAERGYGAALRAGISEAKGRYVIMGDADDSYAFEALDGFYRQLQSGYDLVMGNRFQGGIEPGAMPLLHRYLGNPVLSYIGRLFFRIPVGDFHCGLRGFSRAKMLALGLQTDGMEFASEMVIKSSMAGFRICEVPTTLKPDGRNRPPHLRSWRDGWRHLRFMLLLSPRWLFLYPGILLFMFGLIGAVWLLPGLQVVTGVGFDIHSLLYFSASGIVGIQLILFGILARCTGAVFGFLPRTRLTHWLLSQFRLEFGLAVSAFLLLMAIYLIWKTFYGWEVTGFAALEPTKTMRDAIPAMASGVVAIEIMAASFWFTFLQFLSGANKPHA
jgi:glycosyltransferase involved in cell wall biosynthesis